MRLKSSNPLQLCKKRCQGPKKARRRFSPFFSAQLISVTSSALLRARAVRSGSDEASVAISEETESQQDIPVAEVNGPVCAVPTKRVFVDLNKTVLQSVQNSVY